MRYEMRWAEPLWKIILVIFITTSVVTSSTSMWSSLTSIPAIPTPLVLLIPRTWWKLSIHRSRPTWNRYLRMSRNYNNRRHHRLLLFITAPSSFLCWVVDAGHRKPTSNVKWTTLLCGVCNHQVQGLKSVAHSPPMYSRVWAAVLWRGWVSCCVAYDMSDIHRSIDIYIYIYIYIIYMVS